MVFVCLLGWLVFGFVLLAYSLSASLCEWQKSKEQELHLLFPYKLGVTKLGAYSISLEKLRTSMADISESESGFHNKSPTTVFPLLRANQGFKDSSSAAHGKEHGLPKRE